MDKRIAIGLMVLLLLLVVSAAYAPDPGTATTTDQTVGSDQVVTAEQTLLKAIDQKITTVLDNQKLILEEIKALKTAQAEMAKEVTYIKSKTH